jgi:aspartyl-tRNA(Asn)/glutamyl-tRNA(Gln) amidotransferase subunit A
MKTAMSELAGGGTPSRPGVSLHGQGRNPWDRSRYSGGSSSGSAIVVALGIVPFALGTETGGSIVSPTAYCGVTGLRPTYGHVSRQGVMTLSWSLDKVGPIARSAEDCAIVMETLSPRFAAGHVRSRDRSRTPLRVAFTPRELDEASDSVRAPLASAFDTFRSLFPAIVETELQRDAHYTEALEEIVRVEGSFVFRRRLQDPSFHMTDAAQQESLTSGLLTPSSRYLEALRVTAAGARAAFRDVFRRADVILTSARTDIAPKLDGPRPARDPSKMSDLLRAAGNLAGVPAVSFPCGLSAEGLPVGFQLIGPRGSDRLLLDVATAFQRATSCHLAHPPDD